MDGDENKKISDPEQSESRISGRKARVRTNYHSEGFCHTQDTLNSDFIVNCTIYDSDSIQGLLNVMKLIRSVRIRQGDLESHRSRMIQIIKRMKKLRLQNNTNIYLPVQTHPREIVEQQSKGENFKVAEKFGEVIFRVRIDEQPLNSNRKGRTQQNYIALELERKIC